MDNQEFSKCKICQSDVNVVNPIHNLVQCVKCSFVFCKSIFSERQFIETYNNLYNGDGNQDYSRHSVKEFEDLQNGIVKLGYNRKRLIDRFSKKKGTAVEIGSGVGLVGMYVKKFTNLNYIGIELDTETHEKALHLGLNSINGDFSKLEEIEGHVDIIMLWEVLEHLQDLGIFFNLIKKKLVIGGSIILSVPNYNKRLNYKKNGVKDYKLYQNDPPIHLNFFTKKTLKNTFELNNFKIEILETKKIPYIKIKNHMFYRHLLKMLVGTYNGPTLYLKAVKLK